MDRIWCNGKASDDMTSNHGKVSMKAPVPLLLALSYRPLFAVSGSALLTRRSRPLGYWALYALLLGRLVDNICCSFIMGTPFT